MIKPFDPLAIPNLGESLERAILSQPPTKMAELKDFYGAGIYAIYYDGDFPPYEPVAAKNREGVFGQPIYVGKAVPEGGRKGAKVKDSSETKKLVQRMRHHFKSVEAAQNLDSDAFYARWLVVEPVWIPLGESVLIGRFLPVWNTIVDGFGSNAAGSGRFAGQRSRWDTLHPGRSHAQKLKDRIESRAEIENLIGKYFADPLKVLELSDPEELADEVLVVEAENLTLD